MNGVLRDTPSTFLSAVYGVLVPLLQWLMTLLFIYMVVYALSQIIISLLTWHQTNHDRRYRRAEVREFLLTGNEPPVSVIVPAYNEEQTIVATVHSMLQLRYARYEVLVVNDGSKDGTLAALMQAFDLAPFPEVVPQHLPSAQVRAVYRSAQHPRVRVVDKVNGGKADAINAGINASRNPLFCCVDADSILERDALLRVVQPFIEDGRTVACGGTIRLVNGCTVNAGHIIKTGLPRNPLALFQTVEYVRAFLFGRMGWSSINALLIISGAFGLLHKGTVVAAGGYRHQTIGEDMELIVRMHRYLSARRIPYKISYVPDPVCWTEAPEDVKTLRNQRIRWQRGLCESLWLNRSLLFHPRSGLAGWVAFPYFILFEWAAPLVELLGYMLLGVAFWSGAVRTDTVLLFLLAALGFGILVSTLALWLEELAFRIHPKARQLLLLFGVACLENFGYRQVNLWWRVRGMWQWARGKQGQWGEMKRRGSGAGAGTGAGTAKV